MSSKGRIIFAGAALAAATCLLTACGGSSGSVSASSSGSVSSSVSASSSASGNDNSSAAASTTGSTPAASTASGNGTGLDSALRTTTNSTLGTIVVDGSGRTLYRFDKDSSSPPASNCTGACTQLWPPVLVGTQISLSGVDRSLLGTVKRPDGTVQLTLAGWPLYRFAGDSAPGQIKGEGLDGTWFAVRPTGAKALAASAVSTSSGASTSTGTSQSSGGYGY